MRPLALVIALCFVPVADACFLKCLCGKGAVGVPVPQRGVAVTILTVDGKAVGGTSDPEVRANVPNIPVRVRTNFNPVGECASYTLRPALLGHDPVPVTLGDNDVTQVSGGWEFEIMLPALDSNTTY